MGAAIDSVYGGVADREALQLYKPLPRTNTPRAGHDASLMDCYQFIDRLRRTGSVTHSPDIQDTLQAALDSFPGEWLLRVEMLAIADQTLAHRLRDELQQLARSDASLQALIGLALAETP